MSTAAQAKFGNSVEVLHLVALAASAVALLMGLVASSTVFVNLGVSLILLLPPLRLATTIIGETQAKRYGIAVMGVLVLAFLLISRRIS